MIRIGKLTDYALLILSELAKAQTSVLSASHVAVALHLSPPTVSKILKMLADANLVNSTRGAEGGYRLTRKAGEITLADVITAMEGDFAMTECCESISFCSINSTCTMRENWQKINKMVQTLLARFTIIDMLEPLSLEERLNDK